MIASAYKAIYNQIDLDIGDSVHINAGTDREGNTIKKTRWLKAVVLKKYPTYTLFDTGKYHTTVLNVDILNGAVVKKVSRKRGQAI